MLKVVFLDRDGTINVDHGYVHKIEDWEFTPKAPEALKMLQDAGFALAIITNQSGIAQGLYTEADMKKLHQYMEVELAKAGVKLSVITYCPHSRDKNQCDCRKPLIGMAKQIEEKIGPIDYAASWTIGDKEADLMFGKTAGTKTALLRSRYWKEGELAEQPDIVADSLYEVAQGIVI